MQLQTAHPRRQVGYLSDSKRTIVYHFKNTDLSEVNQLLKPIDDSIVTQWIFERENRDGSKSSLVEVAFTSEDKRSEALRRPLKAT